MNVYLEGIGLLAPGLADWPAAAQVLARGEGYNPATTPTPKGDMLPAGERRRSSYVVKLALQVAQEAALRAARERETLATVFASANGDGDTVHHICETLAGEDRQVSPTRFHNSVHNAAAGYWSIATGSRQASTSIAGWDDTFAIGLLEASLQVITEGGPVLLVAYDAPLPPSLAAVRPTAVPFGVAMVLAAAAGDNTVAELTLGVAGQGGATRMESPPLEALRCDSAAARCLPLLALLACRRPGAVELSYVGDRSLCVESRPWF
jgi:Beta-ketoacyl synthase, N-terminal domain